MNFIKRTLVMCVFSVVVLFAPVANAAPTIVLAGAGSSAIFSPLYDAALASGQCGTNLWSAGARGFPNFTSGGVLHDNRNGHGTSIPDDNASIWISFDGTAGQKYLDTTVICLYVSVDSGVAVRGFMGAPRALLQTANPMGAPGANKVGGYSDNVATLPVAIWNDINQFNTPCFNTLVTPACFPVTGVPINAAFTDIRPEDAQYAVYRALCVRNNGPFASTCLGYGNWYDPYDAGPFPVLSGTSIQSSFSKTVATPTYFEQAPLRTDAITGVASGFYATYPLGALPVLIFASNTDTTPNTGLGAGVPGNYGLTNINRFVASYLFDGSLTRTRDLTAVPGAAGVPLEIITREPLSGVFNTFEFGVPRTHDVQGSQEDAVFPYLANDNPLNIATPSGGLRVRAIGVDEMVKAINGLDTTVSNSALPNRVGYAFWNYEELKPLAGIGCTSSVLGGPPVSASVTCAATPGAHYLLLDGVDPLFASPFDNPQGQLNPPVCNLASLPCPAIPFSHINDGSYAAWNILHMIVDPTSTSIPSTTGIGLIYNNLLSVSAAKYSAFDPIGNLSVFHIHKGAGWSAQGNASLAANLAPVNGTLCTLPNSTSFGPNYTGQDMGSDVGGAIWTINSDIDYAFDNQAGVTPGPSNCGAAAGGNLGLVGQTQ